MTRQTRKSATPTADGTMLGGEAATFGLQRLLTADPTSTVVWSPLSVGSALALVWAGAAGRTADELAAAVAPGRTVDELASLAETACQDPLAGAELLAATMLWADGALPVRAGYREAVTQWPGGAVRTVGFAADPAAARDALNHAVSETTQGLIPELLGPGDISADTLAVLVSAFWLRIRWERPFEQSSTRQADFRTPRGTRQVSMMRDTRQVPYARAQRNGEWWSMVSLAAQDVTCDLLLPDRPEARLTDPTLVTELRAAAKPRMVDLQLPRVRVQSRADLTDPLQRIGIPSVFGDDAELSGIAPVQLKVDAVVHQAVLGIDETGAEAAAATAASMVLAAAVGQPEQPVDFHVRHPFVVLLRHRRTGVIYLFAQVTEP